MLSRRISGPRTVLDVMTRFFRFIAVDTAIGMDGMSEVEAAEGARDSRAGLLLPA